MFENLRYGIFIFLVLVALTCALLHGLGYQSVDNQVLYFLLVAGLLLVLERVKKFSVGKDGISAELIEQVKQQVIGVQDTVDKVETVARENQKALTDGIGGGKNTTEEGSAAKATANKLSLPPITHPEDPQKGRFGGQAESNGRRLSAEVVPAEGSRSNYDITLQVTSTRADKPLEGSITFYLHHTFKRSVRTVSVRDGVARLELLAYGAFTVGAVADEGQTLLELDLSQDPRFPKRFRES